MPWVFIVPALLILGGWLLYPSVATMITSFTDDQGPAPSPARNYR